MFVDLASTQPNSVKVGVTKRHHHKVLLAAMSRLQPMTSWLEAIQSRNLKKLAAQPEEFNAMQQLSVDHNMPFFVRSLDTQGKVKFHAADVATASSIEELAKQLGITTKNKHPLLARVLAWLDKDKA